MHGISTIFTFVITIVFLGSLSHILQLVIFGKQLLSASCSPPLQQPYIYGVI
jgi:hypothetical protein